MTSSTDVAIRGRTRQLWPLALGTALVAAALVCAAACIDVETTLLCEGAWCNYRGNCEDDGIEARCACDNGFEAIPGFLRCVPADGERFTYIDLATPTESMAMGSPAREAGRQNDERSHTVDLTEDFVIQSTEVTLAEFEELMGYVPASSALDPANENDRDRPIDWVTWHQAAAYCNQLSRRNSHERCYDCGDASDELRPNVTCRFTDDYSSPYVCGGYRLPTEAEWEFAARARTDTATYVGDLDARYLGCDSEVLDPIAAYCGNVRQTQQVMSRQPTLWGENEDGGDGRIFDMLGNVAEWCHDWYDSYPTSTTSTPLPWGPPAEVDDQGRVFRGGSFADNAEDLRAARRFHAAPDMASETIGFRVARTFRPRDSS